MIETIAMPTNLEDSYFLIILNNGSVITPKEWKPDSSTDIILRQSPAKQFLHEKMAKLAEARKNESRGRIKPWEDKGKRFR